MESLSTCVGSSDSPRPESILLMECLVFTSPCSPLRNLAPPAPAGGEGEEGACREVDRPEALARRLGLLPLL